VNAGHIPPYCRGRDGAERRLEEGGPVLGLIEDATFSEGHVLLAPGEIVALVTDGVTEATGSSNDEFGDVRCWEVLRRCQRHSAGDMVTAVTSAVSEWIGGEKAADDLTIVVLKALEE
jgi:serine phosphatase RsbU (regulator of sigma subunit)